MMPSELDHPDRVTTSLTENERLRRGKQDEKAFYPDCRATSAIAFLSRQWRVAPSTCLISRD